MSCNNWNNCGCSNNNNSCNTSCIKSSNTNKCKSEVSDATTGSGNMSMCYRQGYAAGFKDGYETGFRDGFWSATGCGRGYNGSVMGDSESNCNCR